MPSTAPSRTLVAALAIAVVALAGCTAAPALDTNPQPTEPEPERWHLNRTDREDLRLTRSVPQPTAAEGPYVNETDPRGPAILGPYLAEAPTAGFAAGSPIQAYVAYSCMTPATMGFQLRLLADGIEVATLQANASFVGNFLPLAMIEDLPMEGALEGQVPPGAILSATLSVTGCATPALGTGGRWTPWFELQPAA